MERFDLGLELRHLVATVRHLENEQAREGVGGSWRRRISAEQAEHKARFDALLSRWVRDEELRARWRAHLEGHDEEPPAPALRQPETYRARLDNGAIVDIRPNGDAWALYVDGNLVRTFAPSLLGHPAVGLPVHDIGGRPTELFDAPRAALEALADHANQGAAPPWQWAVELYEDGLIDPSFALTERGKRFVALRRAGEVAGLPVPG